MGGCSFAVDRGVWLYRARLCEIGLGVLGALSVHLFEVWWITMTEVTLIAVDPTADHVQYLEDRIYEFNSRATDIADGEMLAFFMHERDRIVAGICGNTWGGTWGCANSGWMSRNVARAWPKLFRAAELEARRRGCTQIVLMTFSFQAPAFYERHGFEVVATIDDHPRGHQNFLMRKRLGPDS